MTWHVRGKLKGLMCFHVDDVMISGSENDREFKRMMDKVKSLYEWREWKEHEFDQCGCRIRQAMDKSTTIDQEVYCRKFCLITMSTHRRKHMSEILSEEEHSTLMAKRGELHWLATQSMIQLLALLSLIDTSETATGQSFKELNRLVRGQRDHCWTGVLPRVVLFPGTLADVPELHAHSGCAETLSARASTRRDRIHSTSVTGDRARRLRRHDDRKKRSPRSQGCLINDAEGVFDEIHRSESAALSMQDKRSAGGRSCFERGHWTHKNFVALVSQRCKCR